MAILCFCPPDNMIPLSPTKVSNLWSKLCMKLCAFAFFAASTIWSSLTVAGSVAPYAMFSRIEEENKTGSWNTFTGNFHLLESRHLSTKETLPKRGFFFQQFWNPAGVKFHSVSGHKWSLLSRTCNSDTAVRTALQSFLVVFLGLQFNSTDFSDLFPFRGLLRWSFSSLYPQRHWAKTRSRSPVNGLCVGLIEFGPLSTCLTDHTHVAAQPCWRHFLCFVPIHQYASCKNKV